VYACVSFVVQMCCLRHYAEPRRRCVGCRHIKGAHVSRAERTCNLGIHEYESCVYISMKVIYTQEYVIFQMVVKLKPIAYTIHFPRYNKPKATTVHTLFIILQKITKSKTIAINTYIQAE
jgi:hypothetical protein